MTNSNKKIMILGAKGMLGSDMVRALSDHNQVFSFDKDDFDITKTSDMKRVVDDVKPDIMINCAVSSANADSAESNKSETFLVNTEAVKSMALICKEKNIQLVYFSSDYVFDGEKKTPYTEEDAVAPLSVYGDSKVKAEQYICQILTDYLIIRTSWLFGKNGKNFVTTILKAAEQKKELKVVDDQIGSPTYTEDLAVAVEKLLTVGTRGIVHVTNKGYCSWFEFTKKILDFAGLSQVKVYPITSEELDRLAKRPKNSRMSCTKFNALCSYDMPHWKTALENYLKEISVMNRNATMENILNG